MPINDAFSTNFPSLQALRVLIVDNNVDSCDLMMLMLQPYGVEVQAASLVQQALEIFVQWQPDVLVSEIALLNEDGFSLIRQVRTLTKERGGTVLAIAVTTHATEEMHQCSLRAGFDLWFTKPLNFDEFVAMLACLVTCQQSSYTIAQRILGNAPKHSALSLKKEFYLTCPS